MAAVLPQPSDTSVEPRWGLGDALAGWTVAFLAGGIIGQLILVAAGYSTAEIQDGRYPLYLTALAQTPLWAGFVGAAVYAAHRKGGGLVRDFRARIAAIDVPTGALAGVLAQLVLVPLVSIPVLLLFHKTADDLARPARELSDRAGSGLGVAVFFVIVVLGAPIAEELFFRGLVLRAFQKRFGTAWAVVGSSVWFGATHFQPLQFPALTAAGAVFALVALRADRLGASIIAHMAFNAVTAVNLIWFT